MDGAQFALPLDEPARASRNESDDNYYRIVIRLNDRWRVIECRDGVQWILQYRASAETYPTAFWKGRGYFRTREALIRSCTCAGAISAAAAAILAALPDWFGGGNGPIPTLRYGRHPRVTAKQLQLQLPLDQPSNPTTGKDSL
jgi:hypothetical protein